MGNETDAGFDLQILLKSGDLDIRGKAARDVSVAKYFGLLSEFLDQSPRMAEIFAHIAAGNNGSNDVQILKACRDSLEGIGCKKFMPAIGEIISAKNRDDRESASAFAKTILEDFDKFCTRLRSAKKSGKPGIPSDNPDADNPANDNAKPPYGKQTLKKVLELLDQEEATRKLRILAVDDAPVTLKIISSVLGNDYKVYGMTDPRMLEAFLRQITPELFILDYKMPELSGFDLVPIIRSFEDHKTTPIIFLTSMGTMDHISAAVKLGACDFIVKPFNAEILKEKVAKHIIRKVNF